MAEAEESAKVQLWVYDLSGGMAAQFSPMLLGRQILGIWHTSIVVEGNEFYFGGGINMAPAGKTPFGRPVEVIDLGETQIPADMRDELLADLSQRYRPEDYRLLSHNCNSFSNEFATLLVGRGIPEHITGLPDEVLATPFGQMIAPMLRGLEQQMASMRDQAYAPAAAAAAAAGAGAAGAAVPSFAASAAAAAPAAAGPAPALEFAEHELEAAIAAAMMQESEAAAAAGPSGGAVPGGAAAAEKARVEATVLGEFRRLMAMAGLSEHDAQARALENVAAERRRRGSLDGEEEPGAGAEPGVSDGPAQDPSS